MTPLSCPSQTSVLRALDPTTPTFVFPAMNTHMYAHPLTAKHLDVISRDIGYTVVGPVGKGLACGDVGVGAMTDWSDIVKLVEVQFLSPDSRVSSTTKGIDLERSLAKLDLLPPSTTTTSVSPSPLHPVPLKSRLDTLTHLTTPANTPSPTPPPPTPSPSAPHQPTFDRDTRHPLTLPLSAVEQLIQHKILPPTLVHREHTSSDRRLFWFVPSRLERRHLEGLAAAAAEDVQGGGRKGEWADEIVGSREWLERCYGVDP